MARTAQRTHTYHSAVSLNGLGDTDTDLNNTQKFVYHSLQVNHTGVTYGGAADATVEIFSSEDDVEYNLVDTLIIPAGTDEAADRIIDLKTNNVRVRINGGTATAGTATVFITHSE